MKKHFLYPVSLVFIPLFMLSLLSCDTGGINEHISTSDSSSGSVTKQDTTMPHEPAKAVVAASDSATANAQKSIKDSIGSKISIHRGKVKVVDTTKRDK